MTDTTPPNNPPASDDPVWLIDLDNTLYPAQSNLFDQIDVRMGTFISNLFDVDRVEARRIQKDYFHEYGTTLSGLMARHGLEPGPFLDYVHDIDVTPITRDPELPDLLSALPGRKLIYTNGSTGHAERVMAHLQVDHLFSGIYDIAAADYEPKPARAPMERCVAAFGIQPQSATFFDDMAKNLLPAHELGMHTVWIDTGSDWGRHGHGDHVKDETSCFKSWLQDKVGANS